MACTQASSANGSRHITHKSSLYLTGRLENLPERIFSKHLTINSTRSSWTGNGFTWLSPPSWSSFLNMYHIQRVDRTMAITMQRMPRTMIKMKWSYFAMK